MTFVASSFLLGLSAGLSPGPLLVLLVSETLRHGLGAGVRVAVAPLLTDLPIVALALLALGSLADVAPVMGALSLTGAAFIAWLGWGGLRYRAAGGDQAPAPARPLAKAVLTNFLNPNPYLFWLLVGAPTVLQAWRLSAAAAVAFVTVFYLLLVGCKVTIAVLVHRSRGLLQGRGYVWTVRALGAALLVYALVFAREGARLLGLAG